MVGKRGFETRNGIGFMRLYKLTRESYVKALKL